MKYVLSFNTSFSLFLFIFPVQDSTDYQGRSYLHIPKDIDIKLDTDQPPERCYLPKKHIHTWWVKYVYNQSHYGTDCFFWGLKVIWYNVN